jgi:hypothetical protein
MNEKTILECAGSVLEKIKLILIFINIWGGVKLLLCKLLFIFAATF